ncbi:MAG: GNAT family N-acetyltransferase [Bacteroidota bacterium]
MKVIEVTGKKEIRAFVKFPKILYRNDPNYVAPFDKDICNDFNRERNPYFKNGEAIRWIVVDDDGEVLGRIAAFFDRRKDEADYVKSGGIGYFECIDSQEAANLLFDTARNWLESFGYEAMTGSIKFGENDNEWGVLVHGFMPQGMGMRYNLPYYQTLFENYGFRLYYRQLSFHLDLDKPFPERFWKIADWVRQKPGFTFRHMEWNLVEEMVQEMVSIYNNAWSHFKEDFTPLDPKVVMEEFERAKPIIDPELIWFAYHEGEPIAFFVLFPDANQIFRHLNGKLHLWNKLRFLYYKKRKTMTRIRATVAGVLPKFQNAGIESAIFWHLRQVMEHKPHYKQIELSWVGDFNPKMISLYRAVGAQHAKTHHTYRFLFNPGAPFKRFMPEKVDENMIPDYPGDPEGPRHTETH